MFVSLCETPPQLAAWYEHHAVPTVASESNTRVSGSNKGALLAELDVFALFGASAFMRV
jgi:hypothetical protein